MRLSLACTAEHLPWVVPKGMGEGGQQAKKWKETGPRHCGEGGGGSRSEEETVVVEIRKEMADRVAMHQAD